MSKSRVEGINNTELSMDDYILNPDIDQNIGQTFSRLLGYDFVNKLFRFLKTDSQGRMLISNASVALPNYSFKEVTLGVGETLLVNVNLNRRLLSLYNIGTQVIYWQSMANVLASTAKQLVPGAFWVDDGYTGAVYAIPQNGVIEISEQ